MKLKLLLVFTICSMVSIAQSKSTVNNNLGMTSLSTATNSALNVTFNANEDFEDAVKIYPTATENLVHFEVSEYCPKMSVSVFDMYGKIQKVDVFNGTIYMNQLKSGLYLVQFTCKQFSVTKNVFKK